MAHPPRNPPSSDDRAGQRIAKLLARAGIASRREVERMIAEGRVALNGAAIDTPATILASLHGVTVDGVQVRAAAPARLFRYHKPPGLLTTERDPRGRPTIYDRLPQDLPRVIPVGRLDLATEGLLLLTTDGELKRQLELPSTGITRTYRARTFGEVSQEQLEELIHGVEIEGIRYGAIDANLERRTGRNQWIELRLTEGKNREVRRVLEHLGLQVSRLIRTSYGPFPLADLPPGAVDEIRQHDLVAFRNSIGKGGGTAPTSSPLVGEDQGGGRAASAAQKIQRPARPQPRASNTPPRPARPQPAPRDAAPPRPRRPAPPQDRGELHHRPPRPARPAPAQKPPRKPRPAPAAAEAPAADKPARLKRGAGWAKPKPKPSSRPTRRGAAASRQPTKDRPGGSKK
jgi:23S rRNA pseudouridine2605 synthase